MALSLPLNNQNSNIKNTGLARPVFFYFHSASQSFAALRQNKVQFVFRSDMCVTENTFQTANVRAQRVRCSGLQNYFKRRSPFEVM